MPDSGGGDLAVIIPTRDRWPIVRRTLDALKGQSAGGFEVIVVVDGLDQQVPDLGDARVIETEHGGPGGARNLGARSTNRPLVLFLGDDMIPDPDLVALHLDAHKRNLEPEVAVLGHVALHGETKRNRLNRWMDWSGSQFDYRGITGSEAGFGRFYSCNVSVKREFFLEAEGFDPDFVYYYEDLDCGWRLGQRGMRLIYEPRAVARHLHPLRWKDVVGRFRGVARGERAMAAKHDWFEPFFRQRVERALRGRDPGRIWPRIVDHLPTSGARRAAQRKANTWFYRKLGPHFLDAWAGEGDLDELKEYLGDRYDEARLRNHEAEVRRELASVGDEDEFYRSGEAYLYDLTVFALSGTKVPYREQLELLVPRGARLLDWGCGIGSDGLRLIDRGYDVSFADFDNPSTEYLRWRLKKRGIDSAVYDIERDNIATDFDAVYAFDVIEHVRDPFAFLSELETHAGIVMVNLLEDEPHPTHPHRSLPIDEILDHAARRGIHTYRRYYGRSHLVAYRGAAAPQPLAGRLLSPVLRRFGPSLPPVPARMRSRLRTLSR
ncbi:MAG: glycosyltransferase [Actinomycetota bacterium]